MLYVNLFHSISSPHVLLGTPPLGRCLPERQWLQEARLLHIARDLGRGQRASRMWCRAQAGPRPRKRSPWYRAQYSPWPRRFWWWMVMVIKCHETWQPVTQGNFAKSKWNWEYSQASAVAGRNPARFWMASKRPVATTQSGIMWGEFLPSDKQIKYQKY
jgi:hypothetical protein